MVNYTHKDLFLKGDTERQIQIAFTGGTITNDMMHQGSFELSESLCSEENLVFGSCEASILKFKVHNVVTSLKGKWLTVSEILNGNTAEPFSYGKYKVESDKPTADRKYRDIVAYDAMYDILNADVASWYNGLTFPCSLGYFRKQFLKHLDIEYVDTTLVNDGIYIDKTVDVEELSGKTVINAICELNGCFGHINRQGKFEFIVLQKHEGGLFPSETLYPSDTLYPREPGAEENITTSRYISCKYEDFETQLITGLQIRQEEDDIGATVGKSANLYIIQDNFLVYGKSNDELVEIATNALSVMSTVYYRPIDNLKTNGKPYLEVGDRILVSSSEVIIETYILERTIKGINGQKDTFSARGTETYGKELNGLAKSIVQLKGKTNTLTRTVDETKSEIKDVEQGLTSAITQTASEIRGEVSDVKSGLESNIEQTASQIRSEVSDSDKNLQSQITQNAGSITSEIKRATDAESALSTKITQTDEKIRTDVAATYETIEVVEEKVNTAKTDATGYTDTKLALYSTTAQMNSAIEQKANEINLSVDSKIVTNKQYIDSSLKNYSTTTEVKSLISASESGILLSVSNTYETISNAEKEYSALEASIKVNADNIALKVTSGEVQNMIDVSISGIKLSASQISLEGYTTINGGFSVNELGQAVLRDGNTTMTVAENGVIISHGSGTTIYGTSVIALDSKQIITVSDVYGISIGTSDAKLLCGTLNGYTPITSNNISSYVTDYSYDINLLSQKISVLDTDVSNAASDAQFAIDMASDNATDIIYIKERLDDLEDANYVTETSLSSTLSSYATIGYVDDVKLTAKQASDMATTALGRISDLESRVSAIESDIVMLKVKVVDLEEAVFQS